MPQSVSHFPFDSFLHLQYRHLGSRSTKTAAVTLRHLLRGVNHIGHEPTLHPLPTLLNRDVAGPHQGKDIPGQLSEGVLHVDGVTGRCLDVSHPIRPSQLLCLLTGHLEQQK